MLLSVTFSTRRNNTSNNYTTSKTIRTAVKQQTFARSIACSFFPVIVIFATIIKNSNFLINFTLVEAKNYAGEV